MVTSEIPLVEFGRQHAITMGRFVGHNAARDLLGLAPTPYRQERRVNGEVIYPPTGGRAAILAAGALE